MYLNYDLLFDIKPSEIKIPKKAFGFLISLNNFIVILKIILYVFKNQFIIIEYF